MKILKKNYEKSLNIHFKVCFSCAESFNNTGILFCPRELWKLKGGTCSPEKLHLIKISLLICFSDKL